MVDIRIINHDSIVLLKPLTPPAERWLDSMLAHNGLTWGGAYPIEPRYVDDILDGAHDDGLTVD
jgi:hypothetical protein